MITFSLFDSLPLAVRMMIHGHVGHFNKSQRIIILLGQMMVQTGIQFNMYHYP